MWVTQQSKKGQGSVHLSPAPGSAPYAICSSQSHLEGGAVSLVCLEGIGCRVWKKQGQASQGLSPNSQSLSNH